MHRNMDDQKPELDEFTQRNLEQYANQLWQQQVKTETADRESDDESGSYSPTRENYYYDSFYAADADTFREPLEYPLKRGTSDELLAPSACASLSPSPAKRGRGRPYNSASVKITCLRPDENKTVSLTVELMKLQEEGLGIPRSELLGGGLRTSSKLPLTWTADDMRRHIHKVYPRIIDFRYMKCTQGKNLDSLPADIKPADLRKLLGRSGLYIVPIGPLLPKDEAAESAPSSTAPHSSTSETSSSVAYWLPTKVDGEKVINDDDEFRITLDVTNYSPDEITLKTKNSRVVVHAKHAERADEFGLIEREFKRQYILPKDVDPKEVTSSMSPNGILTLKAPKVDRDSGTERIIPINFSSDSGT